MATGKGLPDGRVSPEMLAYYKEKSAGGYIGLVIRCSGLPCRNCREGVFREMENVLKKKELIYAKD